MVCCWTDSSYLVAQIRCNIALAFVHKLRKLHLLRASHNMKSCYFIHYGIVYFTKQCEFLEKGWFRNLVVKKRWREKNLVIDFKPEGHDQNKQFLLMDRFLKWFMSYPKVATWSENNKLSIKSHGEHFIIKLHHLLEKYPAFIPATLSLFFLFCLCTLSLLNGTVNSQGDSSPLKANPSESFLWKQRPRHFQKYSLPIF